MEIKKVGVVGCGAMGAGIAQVCAQAGYDTLVSETKKELLDKGLASIDKFLDKSIEKGKISQPDKDAIVGHIKWVATTTGRFDLLSLAAFRSTDELSDFLETEIASIGGLRSVETYICLEVKKGRFLSV